jgi:hypothetical protein
MISGRYSRARQLVVGADRTSWRGPSKLPFGLVDVGAATAVRRSVEREAVGGERGGIGRMRTAGRWPPQMLTSRRPAARRSSAPARVGEVLDLRQRQRVDVSASVRIGASAGSPCCRRRRRQVRGRKVKRALIAACTSCSATSRLRSSANCSVISELPLELIDVICVSPGICRTGARAAR